jgi:hypothetical protein
MARQQPTKTDTFRLAMLAVPLAVLLVACGLPPTDSASSASLALLSHQRGQQGNYATVTGEVENVSGGTLVRLQAKVSWYDRAGTLVDTGSAMLENLPLDAGQRSAFKVMTRNEGQPFARYTLSFSSMKTGQVRHVER